jgi:hypothetical protein
MATAVQPRWDSKIMTRRTPTRWGPYSGPVTSQGQPAGQERLAYTLGDAYWRRPRRVCGLWKASATREATSLLGPPPPVTSRTSGHPLSLSQHRPCSPPGGHRGGGRAGRGLPAHLVEPSPEASSRPCGVLAGVGSQPPAHDGGHPTVRGCSFRASGGQQVQARAHLRPGHRGVPTGRQEWLGWRRLRWLHPLHVSGPFDGLAHEPRRHAADRLITV